MKKYIVLLLAFINLYGIKAQVGAPVSEIKQFQPLWQFTTRTGWDWPLYNYKDRQFKYKSGLMLGIGINKYWTKKWGLELDFDWYKNRVITEHGATVNWLDSAGVSSLDVVTEKTPINRFFLGIGPSRRWYYKERLTIDGAAMLGLGMVDGGQILVEGVKNPSPGRQLLAYSSGWDHSVNWAFKLQVRSQYWFSHAWGINFGAYYVCQGWNKMSADNAWLIDKGYLPANPGYGYYNYYLGADDITTSTGTIKDVYTSQSRRLLNEGFESDFNEHPTKPFIQSVGLFVGVAYRFYSNNDKNTRKVQTVCLQVTAKDKYTGEVLPNTAVAVKNAKGLIVQSAISDAFGVVKVCNIQPDDYTIEGKLNDVELESSSAKKSEFIVGETLIKEILYSDRSFIVKGRAVECNTNRGIPGIKVVAENNELAIKKSTLTDANGNFTFTIPEKGEFDLYGQKDSFFSQTEIINASNYDRTKTLFVKMEFCAEKVDCGKAIALKNIHFDLDKYFIRSDAKPELNRLVQFLKEHPLVKIELSSHTDCRSSNEYNQVLSQNRANASKEYLVSMGVASDRIAAVGYGETKLLNECSDGVSCSESQHQINRRTEFKVICPD